MVQNIKRNDRLINFMKMPVYLGMILVLMDIILFTFEIKAGILGVVVTVCYFITTYIVFRKWKPFVNQELINFATQYGSIQKYLLDELEIPYSVLDFDGRIMWMNGQFQELTGKEKQYHKSITTIFSEITREKLDKSEEFEMLLEYEEKHLRIHIKRIYLQNPENKAENEEKRYLSAVYIFDETELTTYKTESDNLQMVSGLVYIDNYDEVGDTLEDVKKSLLLALADRKINRYFGNYDALVKKTEKDKFFVVMRKEYLDQIREDKFSLLEDVKNIKMGGEGALTLSMGFGYVPNDYAKNYEYARTAIDLALGRGGDQAVLKMIENVEYYGGNSRTNDRNTRVKARVKALALREIMMTHENFYIMGHQIADVDVLGASIGVFCAARQVGKKAQIVIDEVNTSLKPIRECFTIEDGYPEDMFISPEEALNQIDRTAALIVVDTNRPSYTASPELLEKAHTVVVFDHHRIGEDVIKNTVLSYLEPYASSTCEMIAEVLQYFDEDIKLSASEADALYAGILIDTNNFMTKTGVRTFEAAAYLRRAGAEVTRVRKMLRNDMEAYKARAEAVRHAEVYRGSFAISICPADNIANPTVTSAQAANELLNIIGIRASFVLTEFQDRIFISSRSIDEINVQRIMEKLGGGGHINTAGVQFSNCSILEAKKIIETTLDEMIEKGEIAE